MTNASTSLRALVVYAIVLPLALVMGYLLAVPADLSTVGVFSIVVLVLLSPLLLKYHHPVVFLSWNMTAVVFFLPGKPEVWMASALVSLTVSILHRALVRDSRFVHIPSLFWPVLFLGVVVYFTGKMTGGFGVKAMGSDTYGGKRYLTIFAGIAGFFAISAHAIPERAALRYVGFFFLGALANLISSLILYGPTWLYPLAYAFPVTTNDLGTLGAELSGGEGIARFYGLTTACMCVLWYLLARWGIRGLLHKSQLKRLVWVGIILAVGTLGGFRSFLLTTLLTMALLFLMEGLHRSRYAVVLLFACLLCGGLLIPFASKLPLSIQRTLSFLPVPIDQAARMDAENSSRWRLSVWERAWPEVPKYLWLGRGLSVDGRALDTMDSLNKRNLSIPYENVILSGDLHSGPLTLLIPFGIWGALAWLWFLIASIRALHLNYRYGSPALHNLNGFLLAFFLAKALFWLFVFGNFFTDVPGFTGLVGLSIALNGGIRQPLLRGTAVAPSVSQRKRQPNPLAQHGAPAALMSRGSSQTDHPTASTW